MKPYIALNEILYSNLSLCECTTVDYMLMDVEAVSLMSSCRTHPMVDLNTSDHLPLTVSLVHRINVAISKENPEWIGSKQESLAPLLNNV